MCFDCNTAKRETQSKERQREEVTGCEMGRAETETEGDREREQQRERIERKRKSERD